MDDDLFIQNRAVDVLQYFMT